MANNDTGYITGTFNESTSGGDHLYGDYYRGNLYFDGLNGWLIAQWPDSTRPRLYGNKPGSCSWPPSCGAVAGFDGTGFDLNHCKNWEIRNLDFRFCARGIFMDNCTTWTVRGCTFDSIFGGASHVGGNGNCGNLCNFGALFVGYNGTGNNSTNAGRITNCNFGTDIYSMCGSVGPWTLTSGGQNGGAIFSYEMGWTRVDSCTFSSVYTQIYLKGEAHYNTIEYNYHINANGHGGFFSSSGIHDTVRFNVYEKCPVGIEPWSYVGSSTYSDTPLVYNNTFYGCGTDIEVSNDSRQVRGLNMFNNIHVKHSSRAVGHGGDAPVNTNTMRDCIYNAYDNTTSSTKFTWNSTNYTFATWQSSAGFDLTGSFNAAPDYYIDTTVAGGRNLRLNPSGAKYTTLSTGGRGGSWPTYFGAYDPNVSVPSSKFDILSTPIVKRSMGNTIVRRSSIENKDTLSYEKVYYVNYFSLNLNGYKEFQRAIGDIWNCK